MCARGAPGALRNLAARVHTPMRESARTPPVLRSRPLCWRSAEPQECVVSKSLILLKEGPVSYTHLRAHETSAHL
eukprot:8752508-Alexandrium_andersonii.AAC.1